MISRVFAVRWLLIFSSSASAALAQFSNLQFSNGSNLPFTPASGYSVVEAVNMGGTAQTRGSINFAASTFTTGGASSTVGNTTLQAFNSTAFTTTGTIQQATLSGADSLLYTELWSAGNNLQLTLANLSPGSAYRLIVFHGESRGLNSTFNNDTFFSGGTSYAVGSYTFSDGSTNTSSAANQRAISIDFSGFSTVSYRMPAGASRGASISGYVLEVSAIPEPSTYALIGGVGVLFSAVVVRRRAKHVV